MIEMLFNKATYQIGDRVTYAEGYEGHGFTYTVKGIKDVPDNMLRSVAHTHWYDLGAGHSHVSGAILFPVEKQNA